MIKVRSVFQTLSWFLKQRVQSQSSLFVSVRLYLRLNHGSYRKQININVVWTQLQTSFLQSHFLLQEASVEISQNMQKIQKLNFFLSNFSELFIHLIISISKNVIKQSVERCVLGGDEGKERALLVNWSRIQDRRQETTASPGQTDLHSYL